MRGRKKNAARRRAMTDPAKRAKRPRKLKKVDQAEQRAALAQERAEQFAATQKTMAMPPFMEGDKQYAGAAAIWRVHEPLLRQRNFWQPQFIAPFTGFCIYYDEFLAADREVKGKGWGVEGKSTSGGNRFWKNPAVDVRDHAFARVMELASRFGFTTLDLYKLERESAAAAAPPPAPTGGAEVGEELPLADEQPPHGGAGALRAFDSSGPKSVN